MSPTLKLTGTTLLVHGQVIKEPTLLVFKEFTECYNLAFSLLGKEDALASAWASNTDFRNTLCLALVTYGISNEAIEKLTNSELSLLILADTENQKPGLIFQQNSCYPKLQSFQQKTTLLWGLQLLKLLPSNLQNILRLLRWAVRIYRQYGRSTK